jgi:N-carbamoylputrescine amidase
MRRIADASPDLILMPHSAPCVPLVGAVMRDSLREIAPFYAREFGVPVVLVNKARTHTRSPLPGVPFVRVGFTFPGMSTIADSDARIVAQMPDREGVVIGDVTLDPSRKRRPVVPRGYWSRPPARIPYLSGAFFVLMERRGKRAYADNPARPVAARAVATPRATSDVVRGGRS